MIHLNVIDRSYNSLILFVSCQKGKNIINYMGVGPPGLKRNLNLNWSLPEKGREQLSLYIHGTLRYPIAVTSVISGYPTTATRRFTQEFITQHF